MNRRSHGRNRALALSACCVVLSTLCVYAAGRYELERRENVTLRARLRSFEWRGDPARRAAEREKMLRYGLDLKTREHEEAKAEADLYRMVAADLSRRLGHYEAAYPEPEAARRERRPSAPYLIRSAGGTQRVSEESAD